MHKPGTLPSNRAGKKGGGKGSSSSMMQDQKFVSVVFDFEYIAEDGKKVFMKENEVLLLINKTNHDWWQVIRRTDRRPFYAPAKYVVEIRPEDIEAMRRKYGDPANGSAPNGECPPNSILHQMRDYNRNSSGQPKTQPSKVFHNINNNNIKRNSFSPRDSSNQRPSSGPIEQFLVNSKFQERYRSNSLDSILVTDLNNRVHPPPNSQFKARPGHHASDRGNHYPSNRNSSIDVIKEEEPRPNPNHRLPKQISAGALILASGANLEKRPTFESLDKRKSWSVVDTGANHPLQGANSVPAMAILGNNGRRLVARGTLDHQLAEGGGKEKPAREKSSPEQRAPPAGSTNGGQTGHGHGELLKGRISAYQNTDGLVFPSNKGQQHHGTLESNRSIDRRKPVPLPRSKIPVAQEKEPSPPPVTPQKVVASKSSGSHNTKASKKPSSTGSSGDKKKGKEPTSANAVPSGPTKSSLHARFFSKRSKTDLGSDGLAAYKAKRPIVAGLGKYPAPRVPTFNRPVPQKRTDVPLVSPAAFTVPEIIDTTPNSATIPLFERRLSDESQSGSTKLKPELSEKPQFTTFKQSSFKVKTNEIHHPQPVVSVPKRFIFSEKRLSKVASESDLIQAVGSEKVEPIRLPIKSDIQNNINANELGEMLHQKASYYVQQEEQKRQDSTAAVGLGGSYNKLIIDTSQTFQNDLNMKSEPLQIRTEPLNDLLRGEEPMSEGPDKSCSTSFESSEDSLLNGERSLEESGSDCNQSSSPLNTLDSSSDSRTKSPAATSTTSRAPPSPEPLGLTPIRQVQSDWDEYEDGGSGRKFYFNHVTKEKSWKPPRKPKGSSESGVSVPSSPIPSELEDMAQKLNFDFEDEPARTKEPEEEFVDNQRKSSPKLEPPPDGYELRTDADTAASYYVNIFTGVRWFSADDDKGKAYYYEENGNESCWSLPNVSQSFQDCPTTTTTSPDTKEPSSKHFKKSLTGSTKRITDNYEANLNQSAPVIEDDDQRSLKSSPPPIVTKTEMLEKKFSLPLSSPSFQIGKVQIHVVKQGPLYKTKLIENGKRSRKNWNNSHVVLTDTFLLFFKDAKTFGSMQSGHSSSKPEHCVDLKGASIQWSTSDKSKRSNVFEVTAMLGVSILMQDDSLQMAAEWYQEVKEVIDGLNHARRGPTPPIRASYHKNSNDSIAGVRERKSSDASQVSTLQFPLNDKRNKNLKVSRTKSLKMKILGSNEELEEGMVASNGSSIPHGTALSAPVVPASHSNSYAFQSAQSKGNIREKLRKFFQKRPTMDDLFKRGIIKNEPVFGSTLRELEVTDMSEVPLFVRKCIQEIEKGDHLKTDGVYRQSGNLSHVQKIRLQVDQGNFDTLESVDDVHVLTGALKLFFRELKEPLIPWECMDKLLKACSSASKKSKLKLIKDTLQSMPRSHRSTLKILLGHLLRVTEFQEFNRMQIPNLAIVFGPTLMWPPTHAITQNMALDMMQQNIIVESLLSHFQLIF
eukprot:maker-scaffold194_size270518-snap-gene-0.10 protein:Tk00335 transcript:maker-scaffold194_size270518-snap-gene-0.10-mRNA-1 annotation:"rho gtpase-activating protein 12"